MSFLYVGLIAILIVIVSRFISLVAPSYLFRLKYEFPKKTFLIMTWGGLKGGISIALALSLAPGMQREMIVSVTYIVVLFSIIVQGLSLERVVKIFK
jgi:CPA1 family monovalent cation:H+ antiporter